MSFCSHTKSSTHKEQSVPLTALTTLLILMLKRAGDRMLSCGTPISCSCSSERVEPTQTLKERSDRKLWINLGRWPLKPRSQRSARMPQGQRKWLCSFLTKAFLINVSKWMRWSNVQWFFLKPHCFPERRPCDSRDHMRWTLIILSIVLHKKLVNAIGLKLLGSEWSLPGLGTRITTASCHKGEKKPDSHTWLYTFKRMDRAEFGSVLKVGSGLGPNRWLNHWLSVTIASIQSLKKVGCTPLHFWKRSPGVIFLLTS